MSTRETGDEVLRSRHDEQFASARASRIEKQSDLFPRYSFAVVTGRYKILDNRSNGPVKITQIATADGEQEARTIVNALNADVQFLANRAEELSSLLAGMTTERDGLREALRHLRKTWLDLKSQLAQVEKERDELRRANIALIEDNQTVLRNFKPAVDAEVDRLITERLKQNDRPGVR